MAIGIKKPRHAFRVMSIAAISYFQPKIMFRSRISFGKRIAFVLASLEADTAFADQLWPEVRVGFPLRGHG